MNLINSPGKATTKFRLNIRSKPDRSVVSVSTVEPNIQLAFDGYTNDGENVDGNSKWYFTHEGNWFWSGGTKDIIESLVTSSTDRAISGWWLENSYYSISKIWKDTKGANIKVAILDTGITNHIDFDFSKITGYNYVNDSLEFKSDSVGHGTHCAGIIAARGNKSFGVAPEVQLFIAKVCNDAGKPDFDALINALNDIYQGSKNTNDVGVINMSFVMAGSENDQRKIKEIEALLTKIANDRNCILISSSGDKDEEFNNTPAYLTECISVGSINSNFKRCNFSTKDNSLDIMAPGENIISSSNLDAVISEDGTSMSAAFVSGICVLGASIMKDLGIVNNNLLKRILFQTAISNNFPLKEYGHGVVNPNKFIETIKNISR